MDKITTSEIKKTNRNNIFTAIYQTRQISKQQLAEQLKLSMPTVTQNLRELEELKLIQKDGFFESSASGGRKAQIISCNRTARISIGVEVLKERAYINAVDLYGTLLNHDTLELPFENTKPYFYVFGNWINTFISELPYPSENILGVGISVQGLVSSDHRQILFGELLGGTGLSLDDLSKYIDWPCLLLHDSEAAAFTELWLDNSIHDALFIWLNHNLGAALIMNGKIHHGIGGIGGTVEHMRLIPDGRLCYCGRHGCAEAYCSVDALREAAHMTLPEFFRKLRNGNASCQKTWRQYLSYLAMTLNNVLTVIDCDMVFSGSLRPFLQQEDLELIAEDLKELASFPFYEPRLRMGSSGQDAAAVGAALYLITDFLEHGNVFQ